MGLKMILRRELEYLRADLATLRPIVRVLVDQVTPARKANAALLLAAACLTYGGFQVAAPIGWIVAGVSLLVYGALIVDVDAVPVTTAASTARLRRRRAVIE